MSSRTCGFISVFLIIFLTACNATSLHPAKAKLGQPSAYEMMLSVADKPGSITFHKHLAATWAVDRAGVINMQHPKAIAAGLQAGEEPIDLYVYTITHPEFGTFLIDSGISERFRNPADNSDISLIVKSAMNTDELKVVETTRALAAEIPAGIKGVFLTHIHLDHILGLSDLPAETPVYLGAGDAIGAHVNDEVDVLISVVAGRGVLTVADTTVQLRPGVLALIPRGHRRGVAAAGDGIAYLSIHRRRPGLTIGTRPGPR